MNIAHEGFREVLQASYDHNRMPFDELTAAMLDKSPGEHRVFSQRHGYHADILRESILETLPEGWRARMVPVPECPGASALDPGDLAAVKPSVGRPKDLKFVRNLCAMGWIDPAVVQSRIDGLKIPLECLPRVLSNFANATLT